MAPRRRRPPPSLRRGGGSVPRDCESRLPATCRSGRGSRSRLRWWHGHSPSQRCVRTALGRSTCHPTGRLSASARWPASVISTHTTVIRRVPVRIVPGWIVASPSRASWSSNAFVNPWASMAAAVRPCCASASSLSARRCWTLVVMETNNLTKILGTGCPIAAYSKVRRGVPVVPLAEDVSLRWLRPRERSPRATEVGAFLLRASDDVVISPTCGGRRAASDLRLILRCVIFDTPVHCMIGAQSVRGAGHGLTLTAREGRFLGLYLAAAAIIL
jgi:hypothetical protein